MPNPSTYTQIVTGPGRIHVDVVSAAAELFNSSSSSVISSIANAMAQPLASPSFKAYTAGGGAGDATKVMVIGDGPYYVGDDVSDVLQDLFIVVDGTTDAQIYNPRTRLFVAVTGISVAIGGGFVNSAITVTFNTPVPAGLLYKIYYSRRATLASVPVELASNPTIRRSADRVRFPDLDRTGYAPNSISNEVSYVSAAGYPDPVLAHWKAIIKGPPNDNFVGHYEQLSGAVGYYHQSSVKNVEDLGDLTPGAGDRTAFLSVVEKDVRLAYFTNAASYPYTKINPTLAAASQNNKEIRLNAADYFYYLDAPNKRSIFRKGMDLLEVTFSTGYRACYIVLAMNAGDPRLATVATLGGAEPNFPTDADIRVKWLRTTFFAGGSYDTSSALLDGIVYLSGMGNIMPGAITSDPNNELKKLPPFFASGTLDTSRAGGGNWNIQAFTWGSFLEVDIDIDIVGVPVLNGELWGDGSVISRGGRIQGLLSNRNQSQNVSSTTSLSIDPRLTAQSTYILTGSSAKVLTLSLVAGYLSGSTKEGDQVIVYIQHTGTVASRVSTVVWPASFRFSGSDGDITTTIPDTVIPVFKFVGTYVNGLCFMTRTDYEL